jgi:hypothetical protein
LFFSLGWLTFCIGDLGYLGNEEVGVVEVRPTHHFFSVSQAL